MWPWGHYPATTVLQNQPQPWLPPLSGHGEENAARGLKGVALDPLPCPQLSLNSPLTSLLTPALQPLILFQSPRCKPPHLLP